MVSSVELKWKKKKFSYAWSSFLMTQTRKNIFFLSMLNVQKGSWSSVEQDLGGLLLIEREWPAPLPLISLR